ncbi:putative phage abortive infection protein [Curvibacter sp. CHRR-16]|uniref:putative phage abortive infection protein n=1 Tax=Curvibacter sp. CHRR-16 TaxID=2835872 RepID=UPI001BDB1963|nr:putative phage abortive infection protein [Curvibacter sp. CHRR-16]MBT0571762.1 putative phage abortive infection protein [Curvibacter sp. CHRR-16]
MTEKNGIFEQSDNKWLNSFPKGLLIILVLLLAAYFCNALQTTPVIEIGSWGTFGDYVGGLMNPLISLFTLIVAIKVWELQKTELRETQEALKEQGKTAEQQRQEQRFFDLLTLYQRVEDSVSMFLHEEKVEIRGKAAFASWVFNMPKDVKNLLEFQGNKSSMECLIQGGKVPWREHQPNLTYNHYFRIVYRILSEADSLLGDQQYRYMKLFRAQLNRPQLEIIALNILLDDEGKKMIPLVEKYGLLKHLPRSGFRKGVEQVLSPAVFGRKFAATHAK